MLGLLTWKQLIIFMEGTSTNSISMLGKCDENLWNRVKYPAIIMTDFVLTRRREKTKKLQLFYLWTTRKLKFFKTFYFKKDQKFIYTYMHVSTLTPWTEFPWLTINNHLLSLFLAVCGYINFSTAGHIGFSSIGSILCVTFGSRI